MLLRPSSRLSPSPFWHLLLIAALSFSPAVRAETLDRIVAVVNTGIVLQSELDQAVADARSQIAARGIGAPPDELLRSQVLDRLILVELQTQRATQAGIRIDDRELNQVMSDIARQNNVTLAEFADRLRAEGLDYLAVREQIRDELLITRLRQREVDARTTVTDQDIDIYLAQQGVDADQEYRLAHILVAIPDGASTQLRAEKRAKAEDLLQRARAGEDFAQLAISYSDGQQALEGGDLDWRRAQDLPSSFASAVRDMRPQQVSDLIETSSGYHILKLIDVRGGTPRRKVTETLARHILIQPDALMTEDQARVQIRELYERLQKGADFAELAREFSDDPGSRNAGGDLGWLPPGVLAPEFQSRIDSLQPGQMTEPFRTQFGWHIATVVDRRARDNTEEARRAAARAAIQQRKSAEEYEVWLRRLRDEAYIDYRLGA